MLTRYLIQPLRNSLLLNRPSVRPLLIVRESNQLTKDRKLTTNKLNLDKENKFKNYERLREKLKISSDELKNLEEFKKELSKLNIIQKFKKIVSEYWHVIICVHAVTSLIWFSTMWLITIQFELTPEPLIEQLEKYNVPKIFMAPLKNNYFQMICVPFFLYKCATLLRYYSTIYFTMAAIRYLMPKGIVRAKKTPKLIEFFFGKYKK